MIDFEGFYKSPISMECRRMVDEINAGVEGRIFTAIAEVGVHVNREELIKALSYDRDQYHKGFSDGYDFAQAWISVSDRLPEKCTDVLVYVPDQIDVGYLSPSGQYWLCYGCSDAYVTHWMPLPKVPEEGK